MTSIIYAKLQGSTAQAAPLRKKNLPPAHVYCSTHNSPLVPATSVVLPSRVCMKLFAIVSMVAI